jgi:hypothetical protein
MDTRSISIQVEAAQIEEMVRRVFREIQFTSSELNQSDPDKEVFRQLLNPEDETSAALASARVSWSKARLTSCISSEVSP